MKNLNYMLFAFLLLLCFQDAVCGAYPSMCTNAPIVGSCTTPSRRYFFNRITEKCEKFVYSGCGGNENNFLTMDECIKQCEHAGQR
ncbi:BPTI/Kunitz inhibitor domain-containing protein [Crotalus adamanteus]|uniref:BPTI/Kunitz inhibitor domain-containing protein n=1 Tax=Crotalus adamanteus TaxID=8729 RepID=A0AAW1AZB0_CROAD